MTTATQQTDRPFKSHNLYESHPSLSAISLESIDRRAPPQTTLLSPKSVPLSPETMPLLSPQESGFCEDVSDPEHDSSSESQWSPEVNAFSNTMNRQHQGWYRHQPYSSSPLKTGSGSRSRGLNGSFSPPRADDDDLTLGMKIPLPTGSMSPEKGYSAKNSPAPEDGPGKLTTKLGSPVVEETAKEANKPKTEADKESYISFNFSGGMKQRTDGLENIFKSVHDCFAYVYHSHKVIASIVFLVFIIMMTNIIAPSNPSFPDLVKVASLAKNFEPMIYYSENGLSHIEELQETGTAVWDLSESMRVANMTSSPLIVRELDSLSESLKKLGNELTVFFAAVDGDVDNVIMSLEWSKRELQTLQAQPESMLAASMMSLHAVFAAVGLLSDPNKSTGAIPTLLDRMISGIFANTPAQRTRNTLERTFNEVLQTLEETINNELHRTVFLLSLFENIEQQFTNIARLTAREIDTQTRMEDELLSSLWVRIMGSVSGQAPALRKYEKNKRLLELVYSRTKANKVILEEHSGKLKTLKSGLEVLRKRLVGPVVRKAVGEGGVGLKDEEKFVGSGNVVGKWDAARAAGLMGSSCGLEAQIEGLDGTYKYLTGMREAQRGRYLDKAYGPSGAGREKMAAIEGKNRT